MALDPRYVCFELAPFLIDQVTGQPLAGGWIEFWQDDNRTTPKLVYELSGAPPNYTYSPLPDPVQINSVGNITDQTGANVALYYFPFDSFEPEAAVQLYYVVVKNAQGVVQFTREGWPNYVAEDEVPDQVLENVSNAISNSQFVDVDFNTSTGLTYSFSGSGTTTIPIGPDWNLIVGYGGTGSVTVARNAIPGSQRFPYNPPYTLTITPGANVTALTLSQTLASNPGIWSPSITGSPSTSFIASTILLGAGAPTTVINYVPSTGALTQLFSAANNTVSPVQLGNVVAIPGSSNTSPPPVGNVQIQIVLNVTNPTTLSNVQVVGMNNENQNVVYDQEPVNRQEDFLFHHYNPLLQYKPIPSYLIGWDFHQNPAQALGTSISPQAIGANTSYYAWDQTIVFQSVTSGVSISQGADGSFVVTGAAAGQFALIQYLPQDQARKILNDQISVNIAAMTNISGGLVGTVSLWYTNNMSLPSAGSFASVVTGLGATGIPTVQSGWLQVPDNNLGPSQFTVTPGTGLNGTNYPNYGFSNWNMGGISAINTTTYFAIVVGFAPIASTNTVSFDSISLVSGSIPTRPAAQSDSQALIDCQRFYASTFPSGAVPATNYGVNTGEDVWFAVASNTLQASNSYFPVRMNVIPSVTIYSPGAANNYVYNETHTGNAAVSTTVSNISANGFNISMTLTSGASYLDTLGYHYTADARLGK